MGFGDATALADQLERGLGAQRQLRPDVSVIGGCDRYPGAHTRCAGVRILYTSTAVVRGVAERPASDVKVRPEPICI